MIEFGKREASATAAVVAVTVVGGIGWSILHQRQQATAADLRPTFSDGTPAKTAGPEGTLEIPAAGPEEDASSLSPTAPAAPAVRPAKSDRILVFVSGAVKRPGVYALKPGARLFQAVHAAGGFKVNAVQDALNQAEALQDGDQIYIPPRSKSVSSVSAGRAVVADSSAARPGAELFRGRDRRTFSLPPPTVTVRPLIIEGTTPSSVKGEITAETPRKRGRVLGKPAVETVTVASQSSEPIVIEGSGAENKESSAATTAPAEPKVSSARSGGGASKFKNPGDGTVNINTADLAELQKLPGVGPSTAQKFIEYRTQIGRFASVEQIQDIKGIGAKKYAKLRPFISL